MGIEIGQIVDGKYRVTSCIGEGGMGAVYAGEHVDPAFCTRVMKELIAALDAWMQTGAPVVVPRPMALAPTLLERQAPPSPARG